MCILFSESFLKTYRKYDMQFTLAMVFYLLKCLKKVYLSNGWSLLSDIEKWKGRFMYTMNVNDFFYFLNCWNKVYFHIKHI